MRVLITGASGFIGVELTSAMIACKMPFVVLQRHNSYVSSLYPTVTCTWPDGISQLDMHDFSHVVHLATPTIRSCMDAQHAREMVVKPVIKFVDQIQLQNKACHFIFVSSQSASQSTPSLYGRLKWECDEVLKRSTARWTILRPGLVVGKRGVGLGARIAELTKRLPLIPVVDSGLQMIQPIPVDTVTSAILRVIHLAQTTAGKDIPVVSRPVTFRKFLGECARKQGNTPRFISVPRAVVATSLRCLEWLIPTFPVTEANLHGLLNTPLLDWNVLMSELDLTAPPFDEIIQASI